MRLFRDGLLPVNHAVSGQFSVRCNRYSGDIPFTYDALHLLDGKRSDRRRGKSSANAFTAPPVNNPITATKIISINIHKIPFKELEGQAEAETKTE